MKINTPTAKWRVEFLSPDGHIRLVKHYRGCQDVIAVAAEKDAKMLRCDDWNIRPETLVRRQKRS